MASSKCDATLAVRRRPGTVVRCGKRLGHARLRGAAGMHRHDYARGGYVEWTDTAAGATPPTIRWSNPRPQPRDGVRRPAPGQPAPGPTCQP